MEIFYVLLGIGLGVLCGYQIFLSKLTDILEEQIKVNRKDLEWMVRNVEDMILIAEGYRKYYEAVKHNFE